jgi:hypothetical protein
MIIMSRFNRITLELLMPVPLGSIIFVVVGGFPESPVELLKELPLFIVVSYAFGIVPSLLYTLIMETWFYNGFHIRFALGWTVAVSLLLGILSGGLICFITSKFTQSLDILRFSVIGALVGFLIGIGLVFFERRSVHRGLK